MNTIETDATGDPFSDAVTATVIRSAMETVCFEMATHVSRTATTPPVPAPNEALLNQGRELFGKACAGCDGFGSGCVGSL